MARFRGGLQRRHPGRTRIASIGGGICRRVHTRGGLQAGAYNGGLPSRAGNQGDRAAIFKATDMKAMRFLLLLLLLGAAGMDAAWAHGRTHVGIGMYFGPPVSPWYYYPAPIYYPPPVVVVPAAPPPVYIEQNAGMPPPVASAPQANYWYYCEAPQAYYPYVKDCPEGWLRVAPNSPPPTSRQAPPPAPPAYSPN